jgi:predicted oxidoreductase
MQEIQLGSSDLVSSRLAYGCMRINGDGSQGDKEKGKRAVLTALDSGYTLFDLADIYGGGACEALFGEVLKEQPSLRERMVVASKCGVRFANDPDQGSPARYDFSERYILDSVEGSLRRLGIETLDLLMLHRPDYLMNVNEVASAFSKLLVSGKVANFGVSNFSVSQFDLLQSATDEKLQVNQVEINIHNVSALSNGVLDHSQQRKVTIQAWCPVAGIAYPAWSNTFTAEDDARIRGELARQTETYGVDDWIVGLAWLLKLPAALSPIIGSTTPDRIMAAVTALDIEYSREDWYRLFEARNGECVP